MGEQRTYGVVRPNGFGRKREGMVGVSFIFVFFLSQVCANVAVRLPALSGMFSYYFAISHFLCY